MAELFGRPSPLTLAQLARRAKIAEGRARSLYTESKLPKPDQHDGDGKPLWWPATVDRWCAQTGRNVNEDAFWLLNAPDASTPALELQRGPAELAEPGRANRAVSVYVIVWDTPHGHVIYLQPIAPTEMGPDRLAQLAPGLLQPRWWSTAAVVIPATVNLEYDGTHDVAPFADIYQVRPKSSEGAAAGGFLRGIRRLAGALSDDAPNDPVEPPAVSWHGQTNVETIARVLGHRVPVWIEGTLTEAHAKQTLAYGQTFTVRDTVTGWPEERALLTHAGSPDFHERYRAEERRGYKELFAEKYPLGYTALAVQAEQRYAELTQAHDHQADSGPGWYLPCRPVRPEDLPANLDKTLVRQHRDLLRTSAAEGELRSLSAAESGLQITDGRGSVYAAAMEALRPHVHAAGVTYHPDIVLQAPWGGPVSESWKANLWRQNLDESRTIRRVARMLDGRDPEHVVVLYKQDYGWP